MDNNILNKLREFLPEYPNISGKNEYINSSILVPFIEIDGEYNLLFQKRANHIRQGGEICFPGGIFDKKKDKNLIDTALRETSEELGLDIDKIEIIGKIDTFIMPMGLTVDGIVGLLKINDINELNINKNEVDSVFTVPLSFFVNNIPQKYQVKLEVQPYYKDESGNDVVLFPAKELGLPEAYWKPWGKAKHNLYLYKFEDKIIWGLTASIVKYVVDITRITPAKRVQDTDY